MVDLPSFVEVTGWVAVEPADDRSADGADGAQENHDIAPQRPVLDVMVVEPCPLGDRCVSTESVHLRPTCQPHGQPVTMTVAGHGLRELLGDTEPPRDGVRRVTCRRRARSRAAVAHRGWCGARTRRPGVRRLSTSRRRCRLDVEVAIAPSFRQAARASSCSDELAERP